MEAFESLEEPETLVTDAQAAKMKRVFNKVHTAAKLDIDLSNTVNADLVKYANQTKYARDEIVEDFHEWSEEGKEVNQQYREALRYDLDNIHIDAPPGHAGGIEFTNREKVAENWRSAVESDEELGHEIVNDLRKYKQEVAPAKAQLKNSIHTTWKAKANAYNNAVKAVIQEL
jgi:hypothetical protein